jgi:hypothetical protein
MNGLRLVWRGVRQLCLTLIVWWGAYCVAFAQPKPPAKVADVPSGGAYVAQYMLVILAIALGLLVVCRPCYRRDRAKPEDYEEKELGKEKPKTKKG